MNALYFLLGFVFCLSVTTGHVVKALVCALAVLALVAVEYWRE